MVTAKPEYLSAPQEEPEPFADVLGYAGDLPPEDLGSGENAINKYTQKWTEEVQSQKILRIGDAEPSPFDSVEELCTAIVRPADGHDEAAGGKVHESLLHAGSLSSSGQLIRLRKRFYPASHPDESLRGVLRLEMASISPTGELKDMGATELNQFEGTAVEDLLGGNYETLFSHIQVRDSLYFFDVKKKGAEHAFRLNRF